MILKTIETSPSIDWFNYKDYRQSESFRAELYLASASGSEQTDLSEIDYALQRNQLVEVFNFLITGSEDDLVLMQGEQSSPWSGMTLDVWRFDEEKDEFILTFDEGFSQETEAYLSLLKASNIPLDYAGACKCINWDEFLPILLDCVLKHIAPHSPLVYDTTREIVIYFHHTFSLGVYYRQAAFRELIDKVALIYGVEVVE